MLVNLQGRRISYDLLGPEAGPVACFAHSLASDGGMWAEQVASILDAGFRVLRADMRGHGGSSAGEPPYTMDELADDLAALLDALSLQAVHLVGLSIGGMLAQSLAMRNPAKLASLVLCDTQPSAPPSARTAWSAPLAMVRQADSLAPVRSGLLKAWFTDTFKTQRPARWQQIHDTLMATSVAGFEGCVTAMSSFDHTASLGSIRLPTLVVYGADDPMTPPAENQRLAALIPGARVEAIAGAKHFPNVEQAEAFNRILRDWLEANRANAS
jgi:3-oxoadipate enol-lactonase